MYMCLGEYSGARVFLQSTGLHSSYLYPGSKESFSASTMTIFSPSRYLPVATDHQRIEGNAFVDHCQADVLVDSFALG